MTADWRAVTSVANADAAPVDNELMDVAKLPSADWNAVTNSLKLFSATVSVLLNTLSIRELSAASAPVARVVSAEIELLSCETAAVTAAAIATGLLFTVRTPCSSRIVILLIATLSLAVIAGTVK